MNTLTNLEETEVLLQKIKRFPDAASKRFSAKDEAALCRAFLVSEKIAYEFLRVHYRVRLSKQYSFSLQENLALRDAIIKHGGRVWNYFFTQTLSPMIETYATRYGVTSVECVNIFMHIFFSNGTYSELRSYGANNHCGLFNFINMVARQQFFRKLVELGLKPEPEKSKILWNKFNSEETKELIEVLINNDLKEALDFDSTSLEDSSEEDFSDEATDEDILREEAIKKIPRRKLKQHLRKNISHREMHDVLYDLYVDKLSEDEVMLKHKLDAQTFSLTKKVAEKTLLELLSLQQCIYAERYDTKKKTVKKTNIAKIALTGSKKKIITTSSDEAMSIAEKAISDSDETYLNSLVKKFIEKFSDFDSDLIDNDEVFKQILLREAKKCLSERKFNVWQVCFFDRNESSKVIAEKIGTTENNVNNIYSKANIEIIKHFQELLLKRAAC